MTAAQSQRILVAAKNDAVLASWCAVVASANLPCAADISPYDAWEACQTLFNMGVVSDQSFESIDVNQFFGKPPSPQQIQEVLDTLRILDAKEPQMPKMPANPFAITKKTSTGLTPSQNSSARGAISPFTREVMPASKQPSALANPMIASTPPAKMTGLPCTIQHENTLCPKIQCGQCGRSLDLVVDDAHAEVARNDPTGAAELLEVVWYSECEQCNLVYYCSVGKSDARYGV